MIYKLASRLHITTTKVKTEFNYPNLQCCCYEIFYEIGVIKARVITDYIYYPSQPSARIIQFDLPLWTLQDQTIYSPLDHSTVSYSTTQASHIHSIWLSSQQVSQPNFEDKDHTQNFWQAIKAFIVNEQNGNVACSVLDTTVPFHNFIVRKGMEKIQQVLKSYNDLKFCY